MNENLPFFLAISFLLSKVVGGFVWASNQKKRRISQNPVHERDHPRPRSAASRGETVGHRQSIVPLRAEECGDRGAAEIRQARGGSAGCPPIRRWAQARRSRARTSRTRSCARTRA